MKKRVYLLMVAMLFLSSCHWSADSEREKVYVALTTASQQNTSVTDIRKVNLLVFNEYGKLAEQRTVNAADLGSKDLKLHLLPGNYSIWGIANVDEANISVSPTGPGNSKVVWTKRERNILPWLKSDNSYMGIHDVLLAEASCAVTEDNSTAVILNFSRKISKAKVKVSKIPSKVRNIDIQIAGSPKGVNFSGTESETVSNICSVTDYDPSARTASSEIYFFPPSGSKGSIAVNIFYEEGDNVVKKSIVTLDNALAANNIFDVDVSFGNLQDVNVSCHLSDWGQTYTIKGENVLGGRDLIVEDNREVTGTVSSVNLLENGNFESWAEGMPAGWRCLEGKDNLVQMVENGMKEGTKAVMLRGKTYFVQDIPVEERAGYQFSLFARCDFDNYGWKCCCSWMSTPSTMVGSIFNEPVQTPSEMGRTEGWIDIFNSKKVRAPIGARFLRVEFRCYDPAMEGVGLLLDDLSVFRVEE